MFCIGSKVAADHFKYVIIPSFKWKNGIKLVQYVESNCVRDKVK